MFKKTALFLGEGFPYQSCIPTWLSYSRYHQNDCHDHHNCHDNEHQRCIPTWLPASAVGLATTGTSWVSLREIIGNDHFLTENYLYHQMVMNLDKNYSINYYLIFDVHFQCYTEH